jgi:AcrR family transcriptional regulator
LTKLPKARASTPEPASRRVAVSKPVSKKAQRSAQTREALLTRCLHLFAQRGFSSTSVDDVATAAGVTKGAMYWHFSSKEEIFHAILDRIRQQWQEIVHVPVSARRRPDEQLAKLFDAYAELFRKSPDICLFLQQVTLDRQNKAFAARVAKVFASTARFIASIIDEGKVQRVMRGDLDSLTTAHMILGMLAGATQQAAATRNRTLEQLIAEAKAMTLAHLAR